MILTIPSAAVYTVFVTTAQDALLGRIAVERKLLTEAQLAQCLRELHAAQTKTRSTRAKPVPTLKTIFLAKKFISEKDLISLLEDQNRRLQVLETYQKMHKVEFLFGQLLVHQNQVTQNQINKCLAIQQQKAEAGEYPIPRLGELLVDQGYATRETVAEVLQKQNKGLLFCTRCGNQYNVIGIREGKAYTCKRCRGKMVPKSFLESLQAEETVFDIDLPLDGK